jgi:hypothetical protein
MIKSRVLINELHKIGVLNISLILLYIAISVYMIINKNVYVSLMNALFCLFIIYRVIDLKFTINYSFSKNNKTFYYFHQKDRRWNKLKYGKSTIGNIGCGVAVLSMIHSAFDKEANPISTVKWITDNFQIDVGTPMDIMAKYFAFIGVDSGFLSRKENIEDSINNNIICVLVRNRFYYLDKLFGFTGYHFIILYEVSGDKAYIADPDNFSYSRKAMNMKSLKKRVESLPKDVTHPFIYVRI